MGAATVGSCTWAAMPRGVPDPLRLKILIVFVTARDTRPTESLFDSTSTVAPCTHLTFAEVLVTFTSRAPKAEPSYS